MRDKLKNKIYFEKQIEYAYNSIERYENLISKVIDTQGKDSEGANNGYGILTMFYNQAINLDYSIGKEVVQLKKLFKHFIKYYTLVWNIGNGYIDLVRVLSLGILLGIENSEFMGLKKKIISEGLDDYLVNFLINFIDNEWELNSKGFHFKGIYEPIKNIIEEKDQSISADMLKTYLDKEWYEIHSECAWYNSHNSKQDTYYGYWAYEAGAIAKILHLNDEELKEQQYYPYDLVHFQD